MFTGIIEGIGKVTDVSAAGDAGRIAVEVGDMAEGVGPGDSVAVDGACLTATRVERTVVRFDVSAETLRVTTLASLRVGSEVNLERSLRVGDRLGGHFVLGHVDCVGAVAALDKDPAQTTLTVTAPAAAIARLVPKGSVAVSGISLTVAALARDSFSVAVIPHTLQHTTLLNLSPGDKVNLELDILGKHVERLLAAQSHPVPAHHKDISPEFLQQHGFK